MLKLKSGRVVFFEGIVGMQMEGNILVLELATKEKLELGGVTKDEILQRRSDYYAEIAAKGAVTAEFGNQVLNDLKDEAKQVIHSLQTATIAYNTSAELANKASEFLATTSRQVDINAKEVFKGAKSTVGVAARAFKARVEEISETKLDVTVDKLCATVKKLDAELNYLED